LYRASKFAAILVASVEALGIRRSDPDPVELEDRQQLVQQQRLRLRLHRTQEEYKRV
jgi:hypothetical protein